MKPQFCVGETAICHALSEIYQPLKVTISSVKIEKNHVYYGCETEQGSGFRVYGHVLFSTSLTKQELLREVVRRRQEMALCNNQYQKDLTLF